MGRTLQIQTPRVFAPLLHPARYKGAHGGRGSGKSHLFAELLIERCITHQPTRAVCVREVQRSLEQSVKRLLSDKISAWNLPGFRVLNTHIETPKGGIIIFQGMNTTTAEAMKSLEGYDVAWVEEGQSLSQTSLDLLRPTLRKEGSEIWCSWNPKLPTDPVDALFRGKDALPNATVVHATHYDNPWFPDVLRVEMEWDRKRDPAKAKHIWDGGYLQRTEAAVFKNWRVDDFDTPDDAVFYFGGDWGFAQDPTVLVRAWLQGRTLHIDREVFRIGCEIDYTPRLFDSLTCGCFPAGVIKADTAWPVCTRPDHGMARRWLITADSARPETISYMQRHGYPRITAARKGPGSVEEGVTFLQNYDIVVHPRCTHTIDELTMYSYKTDPLTGQVLPVLEDKKNHVIDSLRYSCEALRKPSMAAFNPMTGRSIRR